MKNAYHASVAGALILLYATTSAFKAETPPPPEPEKAPTPQWTISLERGTLRENDHLPIRVVLSNPSDKALSNVNLRWNDLPGEVVMYAASCGEVTADPTKYQKASQVAIGSLPAQSDTGSIDAVDLCLTSAAVMNGDYNLLFTLRYDWPAKQGLAHGVLSSEKVIKTAFLGTDSLAGVPLALVGFIVPGLLFWLALDWWKTPWRIEGPTLGDKTVYSILVSLLLIAVASWWPCWEFSWWPCLKKDLDITQGLSMRKLEYLVLLGAVAGMVIGGTDRWIRHIRTRDALQPTDDDLTLLIKLLRLNMGKNQPKTRVTLNSGQIFEGSIGARGPTHTFLVGWYGFHRDNSRQAQSKEIAGAITNHDFLRAAELAKKYAFEPDTQDFLYQSAADGGTAQTTVTRMQWENKDVRGTPTVTVNSHTEPLTML